MNHFTTAHRTRVFEAVSMVTARRSLKLFSVSTIIIAFPGHPGSTYFSYCFGALLWAAGGVDDGQFDPWRLHIPPVFELESPQIKRGGESSKMKNPSQLLAC